MASHPPPPAFLRLAAHPLRWRLLTELALSDQRVRDLVALTAEPQNLVSYHLRLLREAGLLATTRSTFDGRDTYYHLHLDRCAQSLTHAAVTLHPALLAPAALAPPPHPLTAPPTATASHTGTLPTPPPTAGTTHAGALPTPPPTATAGDLPAPPPAATPSHAAARSAATSGHADSRVPMDTSPRPTPHSPTRSHAGPRRSFAGSGDVPRAASPQRTRVLFVCTGNSARSPIAEALLRHRSGGRVEVVSAGSHPRSAGLHPHAVRVLRDQYGIDVAASRPRHWDTFADHRFDYVISLCDRARETCPTFPGEPRRAHWSLPEPTDYPGHLRTAAGIDTRIRHLLPLLEEVQP